MRILLGSISEPKTRLFAALAGSLLAWATPVSLAADAEDSQVVVTFLSGSVSVTQAKSQETLRAGSKLALPAAIRTGADGTIELRQSRTTVTIAANSSLEIPVTGLASGKIDRVIQSSGSVFYRVEPRETQKLRVETPYLVAVIKGTQFNVVVQPASATVALFEGLLQVASPDGLDSVDLNAGEIAIRAGNEQRIRSLRMNTGETLRANIATPGASTAQSAAASSGQTPVAAPVAGSMSGALPSANALPNAATPAAALGVNTPTVEINSGAMGTSASAGLIGADRVVAGTTAVNLGVANVSSAAPIGTSTAGAAGNIAASVGGVATSAAVSAAPVVNVGNGAVAANASVATTLAIPTAPTIPAITVSTAVDVSTGGATVSVGGTTIGASLPLDVGSVTGGATAGTTTAGTTTNSTTTPGTITTTTTAPSTTTSTNNNGLIGRLRLYNGSK